jgi:hypothetical protein
LGGAAKWSAWGRVLVRTKTFEDEEKNKINERRGHHLRHSRLVQRRLSEGRKEIAEQQRAAAFAFFFLGGSLAVIFLRSGSLAAVFCFPRVQRQHGAASAYSSLRPLSCITRLCLYRQGGDEVLVRACSRSYSFSRSCMQHVTLF